MVSAEATANQLAKRAALRAANALPPPDAVPTVAYSSSGRTLIIGNDPDIVSFADALAGTLPVSVLITVPPEELPAERSYPVHHGHRLEIGGWLGAFVVRWEENDVVQQAQCDLILDVSPAPLLSRHQPPPGYLAAGVDPVARAEAVKELADMIGTFEKPKYFRYKERLCAHSRNRLIGCNACIDICSAQAIAGDGDRIRVNPNLCAGCGACTTVCPTGALSYGYPSAAYTGERLRTLLATYHGEGGREAVLLFHGEGEGGALIAELEGEPPGIPGNVLPIELHHSASCGIDVWLSAIAYGASAIRIVMTDADAPAYRKALAEQIIVAQAILHGLGYQGEHVGLIEARELEALRSALRLVHGTSVPAKAAAFHIMEDKRNTLELALAHLHRHALAPQEEVALPAGAPYGAIRVDAEACSLCMACVGACPASALMDTETAPQLRFVEKNCVQCGLCATTCPEDAIALLPRIRFTEARAKPVVLNATQPYCCIRCGKPFGTLQMVENMLGKLGGHPAFAGNLDRIRMCGDCRVIDLMKSGGALKVTTKAR